MATNLDVPKNYEIWIGGVQGLRLRQHPKLAEAKRYLAEYPWVVRSTQVHERSTLSSGASPAITVETLPAFRESSVGPTVEFLVHIDYPETPGQSIRFGRLICSTEETVLEENLVLKPGVKQSVQFPFPAFDQPVHLDVTLEIRDEGRVAAAFLLQPEKRWTWHISFQTHLDLGWTDRASHVIDSLRKMTSQDAVEICRQFSANPPGQQFVWTCECSEALRYAWDGVGAATQLKVRDLLEAGLIRCSAMPFTFHTGLMSRSLMQYAIGRSFTLREEIGVPYDLSVAQQADVPGHSWVLPDLYHEANIPYAIIDHNWLTRGCELPPLFRWRGPDGGEVITLSGSCADFRVSSTVPREPIDLRALSANPSKSNPGFGKSLPPGDALYSVIRYGENCGPEFADREISSVTEWQKAFAWPQLKVGGPEDYFKDLESKDCFDGLPVVDKEISDWWIDGPASTPRAVATFRKVMYAFDGTWKKLNTRNAEPNMVEAAENLILFAEHTFGLNSGLVKCTAAERNWEISSGFEDYVGSWTDKEQYTANAEAAVKRMGYAPDVLEKAPSSFAGQWILDADTHGITSLTAPSGRRWVDSQRDPLWPRFGTVLQSLLPENIGSWFHYDIESAPNAGIRNSEIINVERKAGKDKTEVVIEQKLESPAGSIDRIKTTLISMHATGVLRCEVRIIGKQPTAQSEAIFLSLPLAVNKPSYSVDSGGRLLRVDVDQLADSNRDGNAAGFGWIVQEADTNERLAISSPEIFLWHFGGQRYLNFNRKDLARTGEVYAHLFNNAWKTNFRCWIDGDLSFSFLLKELKDDDKEEEELCALSHLWSEFI